jgi:hypothetical protein
MEYVDEDSSLRINILRVAVEPHGIVTIGAGWNLKWEKNVIWLRPMEDPL